MGINETKLSNYLYSPNNGKDLKSNSLKIKKQEQKYNKKKNIKLESDTNIHKQNLEKYLEDNEIEIKNKKIDGP